MFFLRQPSEETVNQFIRSQSELPLTYSQMGATRNGDAPSGFNVDHNRTRLGTGAETFQRAVAALRRWQQFDLGWVRIVHAETAIEVGAVVAVEAQAFGFSSLNACRIVYVVAEDKPVKKFGFAYGTLPDHVERGEERFIVEWHRDDSVWYDIYAFSRPQHTLTRIGFPVARMLQYRFVRDSLAVMARAVESVSY